MTQREDARPVYLPGRARDKLSVRECFDAYELALVEGDVEAMNAWFVDDERAVRFGVAEEQAGSEHIREWRRASPRVPQGRALSDIDVVAWAPGVVVVTVLFRYPGSSALGRQSQTWLLTAAGWRIVHAHVSERPT